MLALRHVQTLDPLIILASQHTLRREHTSATHKARREGASTARSHSAPRQRHDLGSVTLGSVKVPDATHSSWLGLGLLFVTQRHEHR